MPVEIKAYDVLVVGAGPAGSAAAALFAKQGRSVLLVDAARFPRTKPCAGYISPGGAAILQKLGALDRLPTGRWLRGMQIQAPNGACHLVEYGRHQFALSVPRTRLDSVLLDIARECGAETREGFRVRSVIEESGRVRGVIGPSGERIDAKLVVGADGLHSIVARRVGVRRPARWPRRLGLVAHFEGVSWQEDYGRMLVGRHGYVGMAPLDDSGLVTVGLVRSLPRGRLGSPAAALEAGLADYPEQLAQLKSGRLAGAVLGVGPLATSVRACVGPGFALVGDAAGFFDPFTGEGIFRALRSAELLASCPDGYAQRRREAFAAKERLVALVQLFVQTPRLMNFAIDRLQRRPHAARAVACALGDLEPARLRLAWQLLGP
jgi:geranylgeranyl reductase family protein